MKGRISPGENSQTEKTMTYQKKTDGWETFTCECGAPVQLSPAFQGDKISCKNCGRTISIK